MWSLRAERRSTYPKLLESALPECSKYGELEILVSYRNTL